MAKTPGPSTGGRSRGEIPRIGLAANEAGGGEPPEDDVAVDISLADLNARMRRMAASALDQVGGTEYLKRVATKAPNTFLRFVGQFITRDDAINPGAFNIYVQRLVIEAAQPVAGVLCSPVQGHVSGLTRLLPLAADTVDEEGRDA